MDGWRLAHRAQPVGATASPLIWCRVAAFLARAAAFVIRCQEGVVITNVDDPVHVLEGALDPRASAATRRLLPWCVLSAPLCRKKGRLGTSATWAGAFLLAYPSGVFVASPARSARKWAVHMQWVHRDGEASVRTLTSAVGRGSWAAGEVPELRPFPS